MNRRLAFILTALGLFTSRVQSEPRQMERLDRGLVAMQCEQGIFLSWRDLASDAPGLKFQLIREEEGSDPRTLNAEPINATCFLDTNPPPSTVRYRLRCIVGNHAEELTASTEVWTQIFREIPIQPIEGYRPGDASVGDLDGDGQYEIILHQTNTPRDNSHAGLTGAPLLDAYRLDGTHLWRIDLGTNIRDGEHYTQFIVYDLDGDGCAEVACKTADGTRDGIGKVIGESDRDYRELDPQSKSYGRIIRGPEYLTVFDGRTGAERVTVDYVPSREPIDGWGGIGGNGGNDAYGNRCDRFLACVAYLDGQHPSLVMCRGVYGRIVMAAWDLRGSTLSSRWVFDSGVSYPPYADASKYSGMGGHSLSVADVDADGRDEIVYQAMVVDDHGEGLHTSGLRHGDAMHVSDLDPDREGLEIFTVQENEDATVRFQTPGTAMRDARTGEILWSDRPGVDISAGVAADIDPRHRGCEAWSRPGELRTAKGAILGESPPTTELLIWWDGDLLRELCTASRITKWNWQTRTEEPLLELERRRPRSRWPSLIGDIVGDWREEFLVAAPDGRSLRLYSTTIPTEHRFVTLMHDPQYRLGIVWQNVAYNKSAHPGFFLGHGMTPPRRPAHVYPRGTAVGGGQAEPPNGGSN